MTKVTPFSCKNIGHSFFYRSRNKQGSTVVQQCEKNCNYVANVFLLYNIRRARK